MKKCYVFIASLLAFLPVLAQQSLKDVRKRSWQSFVYRIPADTAAKYIQKSVVYPDHYLAQEPVLTDLTDSLDYEALPLGNYLVVTVVDNELVTEVYCRSDLQVSALNNQRHVQLEVKDINGRYIGNADVRVDNKLIKYDTDSKTYWVKDKKPEEAFVRIAVPGDTLFVELSAPDKIQKGSWSQWWKNFSYTKVGRVITWPVRSVRTMITRPAYTWFTKRYNRQYRHAGYVLFNKAKYQPGDTLRFKAYILNKKLKQYKQALDVYLDYYDGQQVSKKLTTLKPLSPGAFVYDFVLGDSLKSDMNYSIQFRNRKGVVVMGDRFKIEDYVLDEVSSYSLKSQKDSYYRNDTLVFTASAEDANGLALMDGKVNIYVLAQHINHFYEDRLFVPDTLWRGEKPLAVEGDTKFEIPASILPAADISLAIHAEFRNSNNELHEENEAAGFFYHQSIIDVKKENGWIIASFLEEGKSVAKKGWLEKSYRDDPVPVSFPYSEKIDPYTETYDFSIKDDKGVTIFHDEFEPENYTLSASRIARRDTAGFMLYNPEKVPVHYTVSYGNKIIATGGDSTELISWQKVLDPSKSYFVQWQYIWAGEEQKGTYTIVVLDKLLDTKIESAKTVYPGQTDTVTVNIKDYKGRPAGNVNLTAVSYNTQFGSDIRVPEPPYLKKYNMRRAIVRDNYEVEESESIRRLHLGDHSQWIQKFGLDSMTYYQLLFPRDSIHIAYTVISDFKPQLSVHVAKNGVRQEIFLLYVNRELVYYNGTTDKSKYSFGLTPGYTQIIFRLRDKLIQVDSIYIQPYYKHDISFDLDHLPEDAFVKEMPVYYTREERERIEKSTWQLEDDGRTNLGYVWQDDKLVYIGSQRKHLIGPFDLYDSLQFFKPGNFDFKFPFEKGYQYRLTPKMARLEKMNVFPAIEKIQLPLIEESQWILGDTIIPPPVINYTRVIKPYLKTTASEYYGFHGDKGTLLIEQPKDSSFQYGVLHTADTKFRPWVKNYDFFIYDNLTPDLYDLVLITPNFHYLVVDSLPVQLHGTYCVRIKPARYTATNSYIDNLLKHYELTGDYIAQEKKEDSNPLEKYYPAPRNNDISYGQKAPDGDARISGRVTDAKGGIAIPFASVYLKGTTTSLSTNSDGSFSFNNLKGGDYILVFTSVGYTPKEIRVHVPDGSFATADAGLVMSAQYLEEVVIVGYGTTKKQSLSYSVSSVQTESLFQLQGRVAGLNVSAGNNVMIRGVGTVDNHKPLYVVNGVPMDELPVGFDMDKAQMTILKDAAATSLYGSRASNGAIIITTPDFMPKQLRDNFRDYAFWKPNLLTNEDGTVKFAITYPDNITSWQTYIVGMDKRRRITVANTIVKSFKPLLAQLSVPQFLVEGDSSAFIGKTINYTATDFSVKNEFTINDNKQELSTKQLAANSSDIDDLWVTATTEDTITAQYTVTTSEGYSDGELRKIPVVRKGTEETIGNFWTLDNDSTVSFQPVKNAGEVTIHAENNTLDVLLDELKYLKDYPYMCMEQTASKLMGLVMEKKIREALKQPFLHEKDLQMLVSRLQKNQLFEGGWSWWEGGSENLVITNYVLRALLLVRDRPLVETNIRNGLLYLQNHLTGLRRNDLLYVLSTMSDAGHQWNYGDYLNKLPFDSLTIYQQWEVVRIKQQQQMNYKAEFDKVMDQKIGTMLGGEHWGEDSYYWDRNMMATTVLAFKTLDAEADQSGELKHIIQFFLERRHKGHWMNTVESASIVSAILPSILKDNASFDKPAHLKINSAVMMTVDKFPFTTKITSPASELSIDKTGGGLVYLTAYQKIFNTDPQPVTDKFRIRTWFERSGNTIAELKAGEKTKMKIQIDVTADAEYVQIEIPIPAGCTYGEKKQDDYKMHKEFLKNKAVFFAERLTKGKYTYELELEPRYSGNYTLNPSKAELMYFPVFFGRNETRKMLIKK